MRSVRSGDPAVRRPGGPAGHREHHRDPCKPQAPVRCDRAARRPGHRRRSRGPGALRPGVRCRRDGPRGLGGRPRRTHPVAGAAL